MAPIEGHQRDQMPVRQGQGHFIAKLLTLLENPDMDLTQEATWEQLGVLVIKHWPVFDTKQSSDKTMRMVQICAEMKLKIRVAQQRTPPKSQTDILDEYELMMRDIFTPSAGDADPDPAFLED